MSGDQVGARKVFLLSPSMSIILPNLITVTSEYIKGHMVSRNVFSKKGENGIVLVVGGSSIYHGAPLLASLAALRAGTDLVYTGVPRSITTTLRSYSPNVIALPMPADRLTVGSANRLLGSLPKVPHAAAIGMGMSISKPEALLLLVRRLIDKGTKLVLDASALIPDVLDIITASDTIVTPHAGEYARIFQQAPGSNKEEMISNVMKMAEKYKITIVLKGWLNIIADRRGNLATIMRSTPAMTVGGTGDVLDGIASSLLARMNPFDASALAVYFNGIAACLAFEQIGLHLVATDLVERLPEAMKPFDSITDG
ncbi:MAG: NAD(P)H-hydrate dehydratase [Nitrososphaeraceae archaeon]